MNDTIHDVLMGLMVLVSYVIMLIMFGASVILASGMALS